MRLFIGIFPPKHYLDYFRDVLRGLDKEKRNLRPLNLEQMHITLRFIGGNVSLASKQRVAAELQAGAGHYPKPEIGVQSLSLGLPYQRDPRIIILNIAENEALDALVNEVHQRIRHLRRPDTILWKQRHEADHHISLARLKPSATKHTGYRVDELIKNINLPAPAPFVAEEMHLMQSIITRSGPIYKKLETFKL